MYKDLVLLFQDKRYLTDQELRAKVYKTMYLHNSYSSFSSTSLLYRFLLNIPNGSNPWVQISSFTDKLQVSVVESELNK